MKSKNTLLRCLFSVIALLLFTVAQAQTGKITGRVVSDDDKLPLPGVTVQVKGKATLSQADANGDYSIAAGQGDVLLFRFVGFMNLEIPVGTSSVVNASLRMDLSQLDEIVVLGYGTQKRSTITGSVSKLDPKVLETGVRSNPASALAGTIPGLRVQQTSGRPGAVPNIVLRGGTSYGGVGSPLVMVDGLIRSGFSDINQDDIESIEVLKDASATAIYGARANNGVILITTKSGKDGVSNITFKGKTGVNKLNIPFNFLNARDYLYWARKAIQTSGSYEPSRLAQLTSTGPFGTGNLFKDAAGNFLDGNVTGNAVWSTMFLDDVNKVKLQDGWETMIDPITGKELIFNNFNYKDYALRDYALTQDYNVSMTGGNKNGSYYAGLGAYDEGGMPINTFYKRLTFVFNGEYKIKPWLTSTSNLNFADAKWRDPVTSGEGNYLTRALGAPPTMRGVNERGELLIGRDVADGNPAVNDDKFIRRNNSNKFTLSQAFKVNFLPNLSFRASGNFYYDEGFNEAFNRDYLNSPGNINVTRSSSASFARILNQTFNGVLNYRATLLEKHHFDIMAGTEFFDSYSKGLSASGSGAPSDDFMDLALTNSDKDRRGIDSYHNRETILSFFSRANYDYDEKYLLTLTLRRDGYSRLINNRWGNFPGISAGWNIHKEDFFQKYTNVINSLKLRASYGENGNVSGISQYGLQGSYSTNKYDGRVGYLVGGLPFPDLLWERSATYEIGIESRLLDRLDLSIAYYDRKTSDKISSFTLPATSGFTSLTTNNGSMQNRGVEVDLNYNALRTSDWTINFSANIAYNSNKVLKLPNNGLPNNRIGGFEVYDPKTGQLVFVGGTQEGQDPNVAYAYVAQGLYRDLADLYTHANRRDLLGAKVLVGPGIYYGMTPAQKATVFPIALGDVQWQDVNGDGTINSFDRVKMGRTVPNWIGGFGANVKYKSLALSSRFDYALGFVSYDGPRAWFLSNAQGTFNTTDEVFDTYTPENTNAKYPTYYWADQLYKNNTFRESSMFYKKGDYLALREVNLTYSLPKNWANKVKSQNINLSVSGQNLAYFSESTLYSPESGSIGIGGSGGYPLPRILIFGAQLTF
ncbi:SusC/RagA family TonB-linked outer membrane protein [Daejeonella sp.]|uniref:SusC/RagA family TonB-linked outer membrane protein n=1 Tax=Daejeonella sp. TaxID=2805397 RepID=UPI0025BB5AEA|nr:SusC/RagA family TonB-linked outer membrane protein [Daejeonella sp.]